MADKINLVTSGSIEVNGVRVPCQSWNIKGGPTKEGQYIVGGKFMDYVTKPAIFEIEMELRQERGRPKINWRLLPEKFTLIRNYEGGSRVQFTDCTVSNAHEESADNEGNYTYKVMLMAADKEDQ